jgi:hypothetical protein
VIFHTEFLFTFHSAAAVFAAVAVLLRSEKKLSPCKHLFITRKMLNICQFVGASENCALWQQMIIIKVKLNFSLPTAAVLIF